MITPFDEPIEDIDSPYNVFALMTTRETQPAKAQILIVDDEEGIREMFKETLEDCGYACRTAPSGEVALEILSSSTIDLLLLDILMPKMDGLTCFEQIRESYPDVGVVFVTAMDDVSVAVRNIQEGAYDYLVKPIAAKLMEQVGFALKVGVDAKVPRLTQKSVDSIDPFGGNPTIG